MTLLAVITDAYFVNEPAGMFGCYRLSVGELTHDTNQEF